MIVKGSVYSSALEMDTGITVIAPNKLKENGAYKVVYLLHGLCGNHQSWADCTMLPVYALDYDAIFILPEVGRSFYTDMRHGPNYFTYITEDLPRICKSIFHISAKREDMAIIGGSMGGYGALKCALTRPDQYGVCCAFSSACLFLSEVLDARKDSASAKRTLSGGARLTEDFQAIFGERLECGPENDLLELAKSAAAAPIKPRIYMTCGNSDRLLADNVRFQEEMKKLPFDFTYEERPGIHDWKYFNGALKRALKEIL